VICEAGFYNAFYYFGYERKVGDWTVVRELIFIVMVVGAGLCMYDVVVKSLRSLSHLLMSFLFKNKKKTFNALSTADSYEKTSTSR